MVCTAVIAGALAGCGGGADGAPAVSSPVGSPATPGAPLTETATDNKFGTNTYTVTVGEAYTLTLSNSGKAVHNWHLLGLKGADGQQITTPLTEGGKSSSVTFTISKPGTYHFQCDVHPSEMTGTIIAK